MPGRCSVYVEFESKEREASWAAGLQWFAAIGLAFGAAGFTLGAADALAQSYPTKPVRIIVPFPPVGAADLLDAHDRAEAHRGLGTADHRRQPSGRRRQSRRRDRRESPARRLYGGDGGDHHQRHRHEHVHEARLQPRARPRAGGARRQRAARPGRASGAAGEEREGARSRWARRGPASSFSRRRGKARSRTWSRRC